MPLQIVELANTGVAAGSPYAFPVVAGSSVYWFPSAAGDVIKFNTATNTVSTIPTGVAHGWAGARRANDGRIYATPTSTHANILRIDPATDAVATTTHSASPNRNLGVPVTVTVGGQHRVYAFPVGPGEHRLYLRVDCDTFTATAAQTTSGDGVAFAQRECGAAIVHPNGLIYLSPRDQVAFGYSVLIFNPSTSAYSSISVGQGSAMVLAGTSTTSPIYLPSVGNLRRKLNVTGPTVTTLSGTGTIGSYDTGRATDAMSPALLLPDGNIIGVPTSTTNGTLINTSTDTYTPVTLGTTQWRSGGVVGGNGKAYFFDTGKSSALEYTPTGGGVALIPPDTAAVRSWHQPAVVGGNVYVLSQGSAGITRRVAVIEVAPPPPSTYRPRRGHGLRR